MQKLMVVKNEAAAMLFDYLLAYKHLKTKTNSSVDTIQEDNITFGVMQKAELELSV